MLTEILSQHFPLRPILARRARASAAADAREELAIGLRRLAREANEPPAPGLPVRAYRPAAAPAEGQLRLLASRLQAPGPVAAEGVARARALLTDGTGPLYNPHRAAALPAAIRDAVQALDRPPQQASIGRR